MKEDTKYEIKQERAIIGSGKAKEIVVVEKEAKCKIAGATFSELVLVTSRCASADCATW